MSECITGLKGWVASALSQNSTPLAAKESESLLCHQTWSERSLKPGPDYAYVAVNARQRKDPYWNRDFGTRALLTVHEGTQSQPEGFAQIALELAFLPKA